MADPGDRHQLGIGQPFQHCRRRLGGEQVAGFAAHDQHRLVGEPFEQPPWIGPERATVAGKGLGDGQVIVRPDGAVRPLARQPPREPVPVLGGIMRKGRTVDPARGFGGFPPARKGDIAADIGAQPLDAPFLDDRADVVDQSPGNAFGVSAADQHGDDSAQRRAEENGVRDPQLIEQLQQIGGIGRRHVIVGLGVILRLAAPAKLDRDDAPGAGQAIGDRLEIAGIASQPRQAQDRRPVVRAGIVAVMQLQAVAAVPKAIDPLRHATPPTRIGKDD